MPELPEIVCRAREMNEHLTGRTIQSIEVVQPKCLNLPVENFQHGLEGATLQQTESRGKWLFTETTQGHLLINMGMGGELLLVETNALPEKWRVRFDFQQGQTLAINFWWFGNVHYVAPGELADHRMTAKLGPNALGITLAAFQALLDGRRGRIKPFLLNQSNLAGIGNATIHDILFGAKLHPLRPIPSLSKDEVAALHRSIREEFERSIAVGGAAYELNLLGERGGFGVDELRVGYKEGKPCPSCGTPIEKLKTGSTTSYLCPHCQRL